MNIYFRLSRLHSSFLFIHFSEGPNTCFTPHHSLDTEAIRYADAPPSRLTGRNFAPKSPLVWVAEALSGIVLVPAQKISGIVWT